MKEIDFLPEWYKNGIRRQVNYRVQYIILVGAFAVIMVWNYVSSGSISEARARYMQMENIQAEAEKASVELDKYKQEMEILHEKEKLLDSIDSNINVSNVLAELSFLIDEKIVLSRVELISELIPDNQETEMNTQSMSVVKSSATGNKTSKLIGNVRFKVIIDGVAANSSDVAVLLCQLEDSEYSRDAEINKKQNNINGINFKVSEFEIVCYLSNYLKSN